MLPRSSPARHRASARSAATAVALAVALTACAGGADDTGSDGPASTPPEPAPAATLASPSPASPSPEPTPSAEAVTKPDRPTAPPEEHLAVGQVADGVAAQVTGTGPATITYSRGAELAVVGHLDCTACTGTAVLTGPGRGTPWAEDVAGLAGSYLLHWDRQAADEELWLDVEGRWSLELQSWNDLEHLRGEQSGTGPAVLLLVDPGSAVHVRYQPADADDALSARYMGTEEGTALMFGDSAALDETFEVSLPGALAVNTRGEWTVTPLP